MYKIPRNSNKAAHQVGKPRAIRDLLDGDLICRDIVRYLVSHSEAADTVSGIARSWIRRDVVRTAEALAKLRQHGVVRPHVFQDATSVYTLTKSRVLREALRQYLDGRLGDRETQPQAAIPERRDGTV